VFTAGTLSNKRHPGSSLRLVTLLWTLLIAIVPAAGPVLHFYTDTAHEIVAPHVSAPSDDLVDGTGGLHDRGCPHAPSPSHHDSASCLTCRTLQHGKWSAPTQATSPGVAAEVRFFRADGERPVPAWANLSETDPRAPPVFS